MRIKTGTWRTYLRYTWSHRHGLYDDHTLWQTSVLYTFSDVPEEPIVWQVSSRLYSIISYKRFCSMLHPFARHFHFSFLFCPLVLDKRTGELMFRQHNQLRWRRFVFLLSHNCMFCVLLMSFPLRYSVHVLGLCFPSFPITLDNKFQNIVYICDEYVINLFVYIYESRKGT